MKRFFGKIFAIFLLLVCIAVITASVITYRAYHVTQLLDDDIKAVSEVEASKLMIVAHPDDETIWGGEHLLEGGWFVVCITNGTNSVRKEEFYSVIKKSGNNGIILSYPDKVMGKRDNWENIRAYIEADIENILQAKEWEMVAVHNPDGEYGHIHHKITSSIVTEKCVENNIEDRLWYFGRYYKKSELENSTEDMREYNSDRLKDKEELLSLYKSQKKTCDKLSHMNPYENWILYENWEN